MGEHRRRPWDASPSPLTDIPAVVEYLESISDEALGIRAEMKGLLRAVLTAEGDNGYQRSLASIRFDRDGGVKLSGHDLTEAELEKLKAKLTADLAAKIAVGIKAADEAKKLPRSIAATNRQLPDELQGVDPSTICRFLSPNGKRTLFIEQRIEEDFGKSFRPWTYFSDGEWRPCEPDDGLPLFGLEKLKPGKLHGEARPWRAMLHEGAGKARAAENPPEGHPWATSLGLYNHLAWAGGAYGTFRTDWSPIRKLPPEQPVTIAADNDRAGIGAVPKVSKRLAGRSIEMVLFENNFPDTFDLKDPWPAKAKWWRGKRYVGPSLDDMTHPATWATREIKMEGKGRPSYTILPNFEEEWLTVSNPRVFIHRRRPHRLLTPDQFNAEVQPFSDVKDTARLMGKDLATIASGLYYGPGEPQGIINVAGQRLVNTWRPPAIRPEKGNPKPYLDFMTHLIPDEADRFHLQQWVATLIACPEIRMHYGVLLISDTQGVGKGTLGAAILAPLVGPWNTSFPDESEMCDSAFNGWIAHKRLAVVHEIYQGQSKRAYNKLKNVITEKDVTVNQKYMAGYTLDNRIHIFANSNSPVPLKMADKDRRWLIPLVTEETLPPEYWRGFNLWLEGEGLPAIAHWAVEFVKEHGPVLTGKHAPMTVAKKDIINLSRSDGDRHAFDLAEMVAKMGEKVVLRTDEVRGWIAGMRHMSPGDSRLESLLTIRKAMKAAGLLEPERGKGDGRVTIDHRPIYVMANFQIPVGATWEKDLRQFHGTPEQLWPM